MFIRVCRDLGFGVRAPACAGMCRESFNCSSFLYNVTGENEPDRSEVRQAAYVVLSAFLNSLGWAKMSKHRCRLTAAQGQL